MLGVELVAGVWGGAAMGCWTGLAEEVETGLCEANRLIRSSASSRTFDPTLGVAGGFMGEVELGDA